MFTQTFVDGTQKTRKPYTVAISLLMQIAVLGTLAILPLLYTQVLPSVQLKDLLLAPPPPQVPVPKPVAVVTSRSSTTPRVFQPSKLIAPPRIPHGISTIDDLPSVPNLGGTAGSADDTGSIPGLLVGNGPPSPPPPPEPAKPKPSGPLRLGGNVAEANLVHRVQPVYPPLAKSARVQGTVEFSAVISKEGRVENLQLLRGHPLLINAAREAILQWQYRPTLLNGQPVEVSTLITVNFALAP